jgi:hypothetical protein
MKLKLSALLFCICSGLGAQTYSISPANSVTFTAPFNNITIQDIYMINTGSSTLSITWETISVNLPTGWDYSMCDLGTCYPGIPAGPNTMNTATVGTADPFLGLNIYPYNISGTGTVTVRVYKTGSASMADTLNWIIKTNAVGVEEISAASPVKIYPNPASDKLNIQLPNAGNAEVNITDASGRIIFSPRVSAGNNSIDISALAQGFYVININTPEKKFTKRIVKE